jgi:ubiquinone/menaquinone biosynthesis C-methylase UbiE
MPSLSFDPVAHVYDATRGYPTGVAQQIAQSIANTVQATPHTKFLEVGIGTGRIAFPLAARGHMYTGVDISERMVEQLEAKLAGYGWQEQVQPWGSLPDENTSAAPLVRRFMQGEQRASVRLVMADMTALPFHAASFDVAIAVHVFHLVDDWQKALSEVLRVLHPGGLFLHCWDEHKVSDKRNIAQTWESIVRELGGDVRRSGASNAGIDVTRWLQEHGLHPQELRIVKWESAMTPRQSLENITKRSWSRTWMVPDDLFAASVQRLEQWANEQFGSDLDAQRIQTHQFVISKTQV